MEWQLSTPLGLSATTEGKVKINQMSQWPNYEVLREIHKAG